LIGSGATWWATGSHILGEVYIVVIQSTIDSNIRQQMDNHYERLNKKLDHLLQKQPQHPTQSQHKNDRRFYTRVKNLTNLTFNKE
jgi:uncharacterized protein (DUF2267 family)